MCQKKTSIYFMVLSREKSSKSQRALMQYIGVNCSTHIYAEGMLIASKAVQKVNDRLDVLEIN